MVNKAIITGVINAKHYVCGTPNGEIWELTIGSERTSGTTDTVNIRCDKEMIDGLAIGHRIKVNGTLETFNEKNADVNKLKTFIRADDIEFTNDKPVNVVNAECYIAKEGECRSTATGRELRRFIAANNQGDKAYYFPCICWGKNARINISIADHLMLCGRLQSRTYDRDGKSITVNELSVQHLEFI